MSGRLYPYFVWAALMGVLLTSCASPKKKQFHSTQSVAGGIPPVLLQIDETADQIVAAAGEGDWPRVHADVQQINDAWVDYENPTVQPELRAPMPEAAMLAGQLNAAIHELMDAANKNDATATMTKANDVSAAAVNLFEYYNPAVPWDLRRVQILEKRILIELSSNPTAFDTVADTLKRAQTTWWKVQPVVLPRAGNEAVSAVGQELDLQKASLEPHDRDILTASIERTLKLVDDILSLY